MPRSTGPTHRALMAQLRPMKDKTRGYAHRIDVTADVRRSGGR